MRNLKLGYKMAILIAVLILTTLGIAGIAYFALRRMGEHIQSLATVTIKDNELCTDMRTNLLYAVPVNHCHVSLRTCSLRASAIDEKGSSISRTFAPRPYNWPPTPQAKYEPPCSVFPLPPRLAVLGEAHIEHLLVFIAAD